MMLITYDISTSGDDGPRRLRRVAKACRDYGQRVQNSVFECKVDPAQLATLKDRLLREIDEDVDSLRFYRLGSNWRHLVEHIGAKQSYDPDEPMVV